MHKIFIAEVVVYFIGFAMCLSTIFSADLFSLSSDNFKTNNVKGISIGVYGGCIHFVNGTSNCFLYSCSNTPELKDFCADITACRFGLIIATIAFLIMSILSLVRCILFCYNAMGQERLCTIINVIFGMVAFIGTAIGAGSGAQSSTDFLKIYPAGLVTSNLGSGYSMLIVALICAILCLGLQCVSCFKRWSRDNQPQYQYLPEPQYINPLFENNPPVYSSKA
jgi:hypothetical protein